MTLREKIDGALALSERIRLHSDNPIPCAADVEKNMELKLRVSTMWIVRADDPEYGSMYLPHHAASSKDACEDSIMGKARHEGFTGTLKERLAELNWAVVQVEIHEVL